MLAEWLAIAADIASLAAFVLIYIVGTRMHRHHMNDKRHLRNGDGDHD